MTASPWKFERVEEFTSYLYTTGEPKSVKRKLIDRTVETVTKKAIDYSSSLAPEVCKTAKAIVHFLRESGLPKDHVYLDGKNIVLHVHDTVSGHDTIHTAPASKVREFIPLTAGKYQPKQLESIIRNQMVAASKLNVPMEEYNQIPHAIMIAAHHSAASIGASISHVNDGYVFTRYANVMKGQIIERPTYTERFTAFKSGRYLGVMLVLVTVSMLVFGQGSVGLSSTSSPLTILLNPWSQLANLGTVAGLIEVLTHTMYAGLLAFLFLGTFVKIRKQMRKYRLALHNSLSRDELTEGVE
jgi:hypothetical protein